MNSSTDRSKNWTQPITKLLLSAMRNLTDILKIEAYKF